MVKCRDYEYKKVSEGSRVGRLTVLRRNGKGRNGTKLWECECDCGNIVTVVGSSLNNGLKQSCGCLQKESRKTRNKKHGMSRTPTYNSWLGMRNRCYYEKHDYFSDYGGRGISVCDRWKDSFENFYEDMGEKPSGASLDRIDNNGNYCSENCKWSTQTEQSRNTRSRERSENGVGFHKATGKYYAAIRTGGRQKWLGVFETRDMAIAARKAAEEKYWKFEGE